MINAKEELREHIKNRKVKLVKIKYRSIIFGKLNDVLPLLDFVYDNGYGGQNLLGFIWYEDGTWSERGEYDGSEWWDHKECPPIDIEL